MLLTKYELDMLAGFSVGMTENYSSAVLGCQPGRNYGKGTDFFEYQNYSYGEDLRWVDWHRYCRTRQLVVKSFERFEQFEYLLIIDLSDSIMCNGPQKTESILRLAGALGFILLNNNIKVCLSFLGRAEQTVFSHISQFGDLSNTLEGAVIGGKSEITDHFQTMQVLHGHAIVLSDFIVSAGVEHLESVFNDYFGDLSLFNISTEQERKPALDGDLTLVDIETKSKVAVNVSEDEVKQYIKLRDNYYQGLKEYSESRGWMFYDHHCEELLLDFLTCIVHNRKLYL